MYNQQNDQKLKKPIDVCTYEKNLSKCDPKDFRGQLHLSSQAKNQAALPHHYGWVKKKCEGKETMSNGKSI